MGYLIYGVAPAIKIDDWALSHLQTVMTTKLRRNECFAFSWGDQPEVHGDADAPASEEHGTVWISQSSSLYFNFDKPRARDLNARWLHELSESANSNSGLRITPEPVEALDSERRKVAHKAEQ